MYTDTRLLDRRSETSTLEDLVDVVVENPLDEIPIVEVSQQRIFRIGGDWEMAKTFFSDSINIVGSDSVNELEQSVNSIPRRPINCELDSDAKESIKNDKMASIISSKELPAELEISGSRA